MLRVHGSADLSKWSQKGVVRVLEAGGLNEFEEYGSEEDDLHGVSYSGTEPTQRTDYEGIYILYFQVTGKFYIGSSMRLAKRVSVHDAMLVKKEHYNQKLQQAFNVNVFRMPVVIYIATNSESYARTIEQRLIDLMFMDPYCLNQRRQVEEYRPSTEETRAKLKAGAENQWQSEEFRKKIQELNKQPENLARRIAAGIKLKEDPEYMKKLSDASKEVWKDPEYQAKQKASGAAVWKEEGFKERHAAAMKAKWADPEYKDRVSARIAAAPKKPVTVNGVVYASIKIASQILGISETGVRRKADKV